MIYDCLMLFDELDLLEIRLNELNDVVDKFIICESYKTHTGKDKPLNFVNNKKRFEKFENKINYIATTSVSDNPWKNEYNQRNALASQFNNFKDDDIIILSDADEIINKDLFKFVKIQDDVVYNCNQNCYYYFLNVKCINLPWVGSQVFSYKTFKNSGNCLTDFRRSNNLGFKSKVCNIPKQEVLNGGWHFSYLGGIDKVKEKISSFMHQEMKTDLNNIENVINNLEWIYKEHKVDLEMVKIDSSFPNYLIENLDFYKHLIKE